MNVKGRMNAEGTKEFQQPCSFFISLLHQTSPSAGKINHLNCNVIHLLFFFWPAPKSIRTAFIFLVFVNKSSISMKKESLRQHGDRLRWFQTSHSYLHCKNQEKTQYKLTKLPSLIRLVEAPPRFIHLFVNDVPKFGVFSILR